MPFEATVIFPKTRRYTKDELAELLPEERRMAERGFEEKLVGEETLAHILAENLEELKKQIIAFAEKTNPKPIVVITDVFPDSFIVSKQYHRSNPNAIFEQILFKLNPDHPTVIHQKALEEKTKPPEARETQKVERPEPRFDRDKMLNELGQREAEALGMNAHEDFIKYLKDSMVEAQQSGLDEKEVIAKMQKDLMKRYYEHGGKGAYSKLENPKESLKNTTIQFRVISKREDMAFSNCCRHYAKSHGIRISCAITNAIEDMAVSFKYGK